MAKRFRLFGSIEKVEAQEDGTLVVSGIASSETVDGSGEIVLASAMKAAIPDYMKFGAVREMHSNIAAGTALSIGVDDDGITRFESHVVDEGSVKKVLTNVLKGFSIGGKVTHRDSLNKKVIDGLELTEISLVDRPCNPDAVFAIAKFDTSEDEMDQDTARELLAKWAGEEIHDAATAIQALDAVFYLLQKETAEAETSPEQVAALTQAVDSLKAFIASEIQEKNPPAGDGGVDAVAFAAGTDGLEKAGKKFSQATQDSLNALHKDAIDDYRQIGDLHKSMGDKMAKLASAWNDSADQNEQDPEKDPKSKDQSKDVKNSQEAEAITKVAGLTEELAKVQVEKESLQKALDAVSADLKKTKNALEKAECDLKAKGVLKAPQVIEKGSESKSLGVADAPPASTDPLEVMKSVQGQPVSLIFNQPR
jgi:hypothetical protein